MKNNKDKNSKSTLPLTHYAKRTYKRYQGMKRKERSTFLDTIEKDFGGHRKAIIRLYSRLIHSEELVTHPAIKSPVLKLKKAPQRRGRKAIYDSPELVWWLQTLWICMNRVNEKLMHSMLPHWLEKNQDPNLASDIRQNLLKMSPATIERLIRSYKKENRKRHYATTRPTHAKELMMRIPIRPISPAPNTCGFLEGDTVAHCGPSLFGRFARTLNTVDHKSAWSEQEAFLGNEGENIRDATIEMRKRYPFRIHGYHHDSGSEFINETVCKYFENPKDFVVQTRGRPYRKNDQARVEQRNFTHVRCVFGYERIDSQELVDAMNDIYRNEWRLLNNFFIATRKQISKTRINSKYYRCFEKKPLTPYQRVLDDKAISEIEKEKLRTTYQKLNPFELQKSLTQKLKNFEKQLKAKTAITEEDLTTDKQNERKVA